MAGKIRNLLPRNGRYYARLTVPAPLRPIVGKRELTEPLGADRTVAIRLLSSAIHRMQMELDQARDRVTALNPAAPSRRRPMSVRQMALAHYGRELEQDDAARSLPTGYDPAHAAMFRPTYFYALKRAASGGAEDDELAALIQWAVDEFANDGSPVPVKGTEEWRTLARMLAGVKAETIENQNRRDRGEPDGPAKHPMLIPATELPSTVAEAKPAYRITRQDVLAYKNALLETSANYTKRFPDKTLPEAIRSNKARKEPFPTLNATTINDKWLSRLSAMLTWCVNNSVIPDTPAKGVRVDQSNRDPDEDRDYFREADLQKILAAPLFDPSPKLTEKRWAMLIALYSGMRTSENYIGYYTYYRLSILMN
ncbi:DUF6538 domain-containing protein [Bosea sp. TAF32]|uniref:DUF6538 domain-containing protein n=1 Tax=Bosea sp. TAF32 TaxID=3237482 RepID=UPI003F916EB5